MALETGSNHSECYDFTQLVNHEIVLFNEPMMVYPAQNEDEDCMIIDTCSNTPFSQEFDLSGSVYNRNLLSFSDKQFLVETGSCDNENREVEEGLAMLEILHSTNSFCTPEDKPSYVDITELKDLIESEKSPITISDDDDVIFVDCYKESNEKRESKKTSNEWLSKRADANKIRRNPVRSARNKSKDCSKDVLFEEDFAFLDTSDEEAEEKENQSQEKKTNQVEKYKAWPVNVHERPEYNAETKTIETFDYTIREIQKKVPLPKKPRLETIITKKKTKKKYGTTRRRNSRVIVDKKVPLDSVKELVNETTILLKEFFERSKESKKLLNPVSEKFSLNDKLEVLKTQVTLFAAVNEIDFSDVFNDVFSDVSAKTKDAPKFCYQ